MTYLWLLVAIAAEVGATTALKYTDGFTRLPPTLLTLAGYGLAFFCLSMVVRTVPIGLAYAMWTGSGIVLVSAVGWMFLRQPLDLPAVIGLGLILAGVLTLNLFSASVSH